MKFLILFGMCSAPELLKYVTLSPFTYKAIQCVSTDSYSLIFTTYAHPLF